MDSSVCEWPAGGCLRAARGTVSGPSRPPHPTPLHGTAGLHLGLLGAVRDCRLEGRVAEAVQGGQAGLLLQVEPQLVSEGLPEEAVDQGVEAAVGEGGQVDHVAGQRVRVAGGPLAGSGPGRRTLQQVHADEDVLGQPAHKEDQDHGQDHAQSLLPPRAKPMVPVRRHQDPDDERVAEADDGEGDHEAQRDLQPLHLPDVREAEADVLAVLQVHGGEGHQGGRHGGHPDEAAAQPCAGLGAERAAARGLGQSQVAVEAHPGEEEDAAVHVDLQEERHEGAERGDVVVLLVQVEHLDQRVCHQDEVRGRQVGEVQVGDGHLLPEADVHHQDQEVAREADGEEEDGVEAGQEEPDGALLLLRERGRAVGQRAGQAEAAGGAVGGARRRLHAGPGARRDSRPLRICRKAPRNRFLTGNPS
ncbi:uncharacterized protein [Tursiops truncatus]|uniref:uncharacterized protein n=1 Tax=Tursiops truncatus TaxID=9739 RepID=UPI003CCFADA3